MTGETTVGTVLAQALHAAECDRAFLVPGESYLPLLEGMRCQGIAPIICRNEGGAAFMALADSVMTGRPGIAMVTRGPGAANSMIGVSSAWQDGVPMLLFVGLVRLDERDRHSFQEFDLRGWFGTIAKRVFVIDTPVCAHGVVEEAIRIAMSGRPGPVVIGLPEDVLGATVDERESQTPSERSSAPSEDLPRAIENLFTGVDRPLIVAGGRGWKRETCAALRTFAEGSAIPVLGDFRSGDRLRVESPSNAGWLGFGTHSGAWELLASCDALLVLGTVLGDVATRGWSILPPARTIVVNPDPELRGHIAPPLRHFVSEITPALGLLADMRFAGRGEWEDRTDRAHAEFLRSRAFESAPRAVAEDPVRVAEVMRAVEALMPDDAIVTYGAGQHCIWPQRYLAKGGFRSELGLQNGAMGYSVPAAVAASLRSPDRLVVCVAGDGEFMMNGQELATAVQYGASMLLIIVDNAVFGTIRAHQAAMYPEGRFAVDLENPDFAALVRAYGAEAFRIERARDAESAVGAAWEAVRSGRIAVLHVLASEGDTGE